VRRTVAILIYDDVEVLDFAGPFEVFAVADELHDHRLFDVALVAAREDIVHAVNGMRVVPNRTLAQCSRPDVVVIAGGTGSRRAMHDPAVLDWVREAARHATVVMSVCSGARILARLGLLDGLEATTHHQVFDHLAELAPKARLRRGLRFIDTGRIPTTAGIAAGIDGSLHVVARLAGLEAARRTAEYMEYPWTPDPAGHRPGDPDGTSPSLGSEHGKGIEPRRAPGGQP